MNGRKEVVFSESSGVCVYVKHFHRNIVVCHNVIVIMANGGFLSASTKRHINDCLSVLGVNAYVFQRNRVWYLFNGEKISGFFDGCFVTY